MTAARRRVVIRGCKAKMAPHPISMRHIRILCPICCAPLSVLRHTKLSGAYGVGFQAICGACDKWWQHLQWQPEAFEVNDPMTIADLFPPSSRRPVLAPSCAECREPIERLDEFFWHPALPGGPLHRACLARVAPSLVARALAGELPMALVEAMGVAC